MKSSPAPKAALSPSAAASAASAASMMAGDHHRNGNGTDKPLTDGISIPQHQQNNQRRRHQTTAPTTSPPTTTPNNNNPFTPKPDASPEISKLWMSGSSPKSSNNYPTPRRQLHYRSASSSSPSSSPPHHLQQKQQRRRRCKLLLTGVIAASTWMYLSVAWFAVSQWYYLERQTTSSSSSSSVATDNNNSKQSSFSFLPSISTNKKNDNKFATIRGTIIRNGGDGLPGEGEGKDPTYNDKDNLGLDHPTSNLNNDDDKRLPSQQQPRIFNLDYELILPARMQNNPNLPPADLTILVPITKTRKGEASLPSIFLPSIYSNKFNIKGHDNATIADDTTEKIDGGGMGLHDIIIRGGNSVNSTTHQSDDDGEDNNEEKSFVVISSSNNVSNSNSKVATDHVDGTIDGTDDIGDSSSCQAMQNWQTQLLITCNNFHELDWLQPQFLAQGWFRDTWKYDDELVLKTLRWEREYLDEYYELHRRDAIAMEHLTFSPFVLNIHGYCGQSALNEFASGVGDVNSLEVMDRRLRGKESKSWKLKLRLATTVAVGLVHIQYGPPSVAFGKDRNVTLQEYLNETETPASMSHYDLNPRNIAIMSGGRPKINDFNVAEFLTVPKSDDDTSSAAKKYNDCGKFRSRLHDPWWRAPEEMNLNSTSYVDEKVDVYALGNVLFHILTTHSPRGKMKKDRAPTIRKEVGKGIKPQLPPAYRDAKGNHVVEAFRKAFDLCFEPDPSKRGTSKQVAIVLHDAYQVMLEEQRQQVEAEKQKKKKDKEKKK